MQYDDIIINYVPLQHCLCDLSLNPGPHLPTCEHIPIIQGPHTNICTKTGICKCFLHDDIVLARARLYEEGLLCQAKSKLCREKHIQFYPSFISNTLYAGVELELDFENTYIAFQVVRLFHRYNIDLKKFFCITLDGSLKNGLEFISRPMTLPYHYIALCKLLDFIYYIGKEHNIYPILDTSTGLHVHVSRYEENKEFEHLQTFFTISNYQITIDIWAGRKETNACQRQITAVHRSTALNLCNTKTVEFRLFQSTFNFIKIIKIIHDCIWLVQNKNIDHNIMFETIQKNIISHL